eukprot:GFKZ01008949.1.p1 GENE.GFKZ01008949.1~~GFKZ01008949.1.p1  ORF type:complete len:553 (-),score=72.12 GFKZ01008949.1:2159-3817(-)
MSSSLSSSLESQYGLRNIRSTWLRRHSQLSISEIIGPICRSDLSQISQGTLPWSISTAHSVQLDTKVLVQIDDLINIANSNPRSPDPPRVLQITLSDGALDFVAVELEPCPRLSLLTVPGTKLVLHPTALARRGRLFLTPTDFTFLGAPACTPANNIVWADQRDRKIAQALAAAGLHNPNLSSFDTIASGNAPFLPDMGGIADAVRIADENDPDNDDDFWAQAVAVAEQSEAQAASDRQNAARAHGGASYAVDGARGIGNGIGAMVCDEVNVGGDAASRHTAPGAGRGVGGRLAGVGEAVNGGGGAVPRPVPTVVTPVSRDAVDVTEAVPIRGSAMVAGPPPIDDVPEMPECESDPVCLNSDADFAVEGDCDIIEDTYDVDIPARPFSRLEQVEEALMDEAGSRTQHQRFLFRAYVPSSKKRPRATPYKGCIKLAVSFDDGTSLTKLAVRDNLFGDLSAENKNEVLNNASSSEGVSTGSGISNPFLDNPLAYADTLVKYSRAIHGFIQVEWDGENAIVTDVSQEPPGGLVSYFYTKLSERSQRTGTNFTCIN